MAANPESFAAKPATTNIAELRKPLAPEAQMPIVRAGFFDLQGFELMQRVAKAFASSTLVPQAYQNNIPNCMIALNLAQRLRADELMVMQNLYIVHGRPGWSSQFLIATFNQNGRFTAIRYEFFGEKDTDSWGCRAWAIETSTGEKIVGPDITIGLARKEGWYDKSGSKWKTIPQLMLMYRAAGWTIRVYAPEIAMGLPTAEEIGDTYDAQRDAGGGFSVGGVDALREPVGEMKQQPGNVIDAEPEPANEPAAEPASSVPAKPEVKAGGKKDPASPKPLTQAQLLEKFAKAHAAKDVDLLDAHADLIKQLPDEAQQQEAFVEYKRLRTELVPE